MNFTHLISGFSDGRYVLPPLSYGDSALEPLICAETLYLHHDKHHAAYVDGANAAMDGLALIRDGGLSPAQAPSLTQSLMFNLGGHILHTLYWENLSSSKLNEPGELMQSAIDDSFGSYDAFRKIFIAVCTSVQGSGWGVLGADPVSRRLLITGICRHQDVLVPGFYPLLVCDVWEHAYYLTWSNDRKGYVHAFMEQINWLAIETRYEKFLRSEI